MEEYYDLGYLDVCTNEIDKQYQFYFDSADIVKIIQGVNRFYEKKENEIKFNAYLFNRNETIVHSLALGGFLNKGIKLLPPHQAELSKLIKNEKGGTSIFFDNSSNILKNFLEKDLDFFSKLTDITTNKHIPLDDVYIQQWIDEKANEIFKAIYFSYQAGYNERLNELFKNKIIVTEAYDLTDLEIWDIELFSSLTDIFRKTRPDKEWGWSNFNDVAAFIHLAKKVRDFNDNNSNRLPIYYDSHNYSDSFPEDLMNKYFRIKINESDHKKNSYAFRKWNFFQIYALLNFNKTTSLIDEDKQYFGFATTKHFIEKLLASFNDKKLNKEIQKVETLYEKEVVEFNKDLNTYINVDFYRVIINRIFRTKIEIVNKILEDYKKQKLNAESAEIVKRQGDIILEYLNDKIDDILEETSSMYHLIENRLIYVKKLNTQLSKTGDELDVFKHYSLFRFFIPKDFQTTIKYFFSKDGLLSDDKETTNEAKTTLWQLYYRTVYLKHSEKSNLPPRSLLAENELYILFSTFWILNLHDKISNFNFEKKYLSSLSHSLLMLIGASINRTITEANSEYEGAEILLFNYKNVIAILEARVLETSNDKKAQIEIVLAYLYFHLWHQEGNKLILERPFYDNEEVVYEPNTHNFIAINYAKKAYTFYTNKKENNNPYLLYALNIYIYYVIESGPTSLFKEIRALITDFVKLKDAARDWSFRYDDTIARNLHRIAKILPEKQKKLEYIGNTAFLLEKTLEKTGMLEGKDIKEVRTYYEIVISIKSEIELDI